MYGPRIVRANRETFLSPYIPPKDVRILNALPTPSTSVDIVETNPVFASRPSFSEPSHHYADEGLSIADYLQLLRRWKWLALGVFSVIVLASILWTLNQPKLYKSEASIIIRTESSVQLFPLSSNERITRIMSAESDFLQSTSFEDSAQTQAGNNDPVDIEVGDLSARITPSLITFVATSSSPERAAETAESWAETYIGLRHQADVSETEKSITTLENSAKTLEAERQRILSPLDTLSEQLSETEDPDTITRLSTERITLLQQLAPQLRPVEAQLSEINTELAEQRLLSEFLEDPNVSARVNRFAEVPASPTSPSIPQNLALGVVAGALVAVAAVLGAASFDDKVRSADDIEETIGVGPLAILPTNDRGSNPIALVEGSPAAEAYQRLISSIDFARSAGANNKVLLVTSPEKGEGKSTTSARLALALANEGRYVIVVGGDLRRPSLSSLYRTASGPGLSDYLTGNATLDSCLHSIQPTLAILPAGTNRGQRNPAEILRSHDLLVTIDKLRDHCDHIIIDAPPVLPVVDALELAESADGIILCAFGKKTRKRALEDTHRRLIESNAPRILGFVLSGTNEANYNYNYKADFH